MKLNLTSAGRIQVMKGVSFLIIGKTLLVGRGDQSYNSHKQNQLLVATQITVSLLDTGIYLCQTLYG